MSKFFKSKDQFWELFIPIIFVIGLSLLVLFADWDRKISQLFFDSQTHLWILRQHPLVVFANKYGPFISVTLFVTALILLIGSYLVPKLYVYRIKSYFIVISIIVIPVFLTHAVIKNQWKRPRPRNTIEFNGNHPFFPFTTIANHDFKGKSFPSGHAASGFILTILYFLLKKKSRKKALFALAATMVFGIWISIARIAVGGHYFSDILMSFALCWFFSYFFYYFWLLPADHKSRSRQAFKFSKRRLLLPMITVAILACVITGYNVLVQPFRIDYGIKLIKVPKSVSSIDISILAERGNIHIFRHDENDIKIRLRVIGRGLANQGLNINYSYSINQTEMKLHHQTSPTSMVIKHQSHVSVYIPKSLKVSKELIHTKLGTIFRSPTQ